MSARAGAACDPWNYGSRGHCCVACLPKGARVRRVLNWVALARECAWLQQEPHYCAAHVHVLRPALWPMHPRGVRCAVLTYTHILGCAPS